MMFKDIINRLKKKPLLVVLLLLFFAVNVFVLTRTFTEKTSSTIWDGKVASKFEKGNGSIDNPYIIDNGSQLAYFFKLIHSDNSTEYFNKNYEITNNINLDGRDFSFANFNKQFSGTLNGGGYTISNFKISDYYLDPEETVASFSLFDSLYNAKIININFRDITFVVNDDITVKNNILEDKDIKEEPEEKEDINKTASLKKYSVRFVNEEVSTDEGNNTETPEIKEEIKEETKEENKDEVKTEEPKAVEEQKTEEPKIDEEEKEEPKQEDTITTTEENNGDTTTNEENKTEEETKEENKEDNNIDEVVEPDKTEEKNDDITTNEEEKNEEETKEEENKTEEDNEPEDNKEEEIKTDEESGEKDEIVDNKVQNISVSLFNNVNHSTIKNINVVNINLEYKGEEKRLKSSLFILNDIGENNIENIHVIGNSNVESTNLLIDSFNGSNLKNIMFKSNKLKLLDEFDYKKKYDVYEYTVGKEGISFNSKRTVEYVISEFNNNSDLVWKYENNDFRIVNNGSDPVSKKKKAPLRGAKRSTINEHASGINNNTVYVNDLTADLNYYRGLNYTEVRSTSLPSGTSTHYYDDDYLVKVEIIYDGADINDSTLVGTVSPINNENSNKYVYFKYYPLQRNSGGTLLTDSNNSNYIRVELIDNPFSKRPYTGSGNNIIEYGFNGWVCNQNNDTTDDLCDTITFGFRKDDFVRYMDIPVDGGSELVIHLNASWYEADVQSTSNISSLRSMQMASTSYQITVNESRDASPYWSRNYTQMVYESTVSSGNRVARYRWYRNSATSGTYIYNSSNRFNCPYTTCYIYNYRNNAIVSGTLYDEEPISFVPNFSSYGNNTEVTISSYNPTYHTLRENPGGSYSITVQVQKNRSYITGDNTEGFYYQVSNPTSQMINTGKYYTNTGDVCTSTSGCTTAYKLVQHNDTTLNTNGNSISQLEMVDNSIVDATRYYYLVTRDMNIVRTTGAVSYSNLNTNRPYTLTGTSVNGTSVSGRITINYYNWSVPGDIAIENIQLDGADRNLTSTTFTNATLGFDVTNRNNYSRRSGAIYANSHNFKIGRNVTSYDGTSYLSIGAIYGSSYDGGPSGTFRVIVESGYYFAYHSGRMDNSTTNYTFNETTIFGSDYDRVANSHQKLRFTIGLDGFAGGRNNAGSDSLFVSYNIIKSGSLGYNYDGTANSDDTAGLYIGARADKFANSITGAKIEGGNINMVVGGYGYNGSATTNSTFIGMSGGNVRQIYGGAGHSTTVGNRIICVTGGTVSYSVLGGSNSFESGDTSDGRLQGDTLVYVGGNATIGGGSGKLFGVESGSVFGAGGGDTSSTGKGTVYNSHVIINGGTINSSVYGGGNYGSTGTVNSSTSNTKIEVYSGTIGNIYGGSRSADFSQDSRKTTSKIEIDVKGGTIGNIYGGSNRHGTIYGTIEVNVTGGTITGNVYGGGRGGAEPENPPDPSTNGTFTANSVSVIIGNQSGGPSIGGSVYGGSAFGSVNGTNLGNVSVTINAGTITGYVFGGGQGDSTHTPVVNGNITVTVEGGSVTKVFGGHDQVGSHTKQNEVHLNGGTVGEAYGGGNKSSVTNTHVYLAGGTVRDNLFGGSNESGAVSTTRVEVSSGSAGTVYGGNNQGGTCGTTSIEVTGGSIGTIYGGGNLVSTTSTDIDIYNHSGTISAIYGGGHSAGATTTSVELKSRSGNNNINVTKIHGGSDQSGNVTTANVTIAKGTVGTLYGGNNEGGTTATSNIEVNGGSVTTLFGGGNEAVTGTTVVEINGGTFGTIYGGGNEAAVTTDTSVTINSATAVNGRIYGGGKSGNVGGDTNVVIKNIGNTVSYVFGGGDAAGATNTNVELVKLNSGSNNISITNLFGGSNQSGNVTSSEIIVNTGTVASLYGGNNQGGKTTTTNIEVNAGNITTMFGGGSQAVTDYTNIETNGGTFGTIYGGGDAAIVTYTTKVDINSATINTKLFGGGNEGAVNGSTEVNIKNLGTTLPELYGGGNQAGTPSTNVNLIKLNSGANNITVGSLFGGSNIRGDVTTSNIDIDTGTVSFIYGGNNAGGETTTTNIDISAGSHGYLYGGGNQADSDYANVTTTGGSYTAIYGGGKSADITEDVTLDISNATIVLDIYGGGDAGDVGGDVTFTLTDSTVDYSVYGGGNQGSVGGDITLTIDGTDVGGGNCGLNHVCSIFGGGNQGAVSGSVTLTATETTVGNTICDTDDHRVCSIYGGGNFGSVSGSTSVSLEDIMSYNSVYAGGNGSTANVIHNTSITVSGTSVIGTTNCTVLSTCSVFGGGNAAATGTNAANNSQATVDITGATVYGNAYGGANTSKVFGATVINVGDGIVPEENETKDDVSIHGTVFGGGEANADGSDEYDWTFISVTQGINVNIDGTGYDNFEILGSIFGSGNASTASGTSEVMIKNYGTFANPQRNISIQRTDYLTIDNSALILVGATDRENEYSSVLFSLSRIGELDLMNNSTLFLETGANLLEEFKSLDANGNPAEVDIDIEHETVEVYTDNRVYMYLDKKLNIAKDQSVTDYGEVTGMSFFGMYKYNQNGTVNTGIYDKYDYNDILDSSGVFANATSYVLGLHKTSHNIKVDGFYSNFIDPETKENKMDYIDPIPPTGPLYMWTIGQGVIEYTVDLVASKYSTLGTYELSLTDFTDPNTSFEVTGFDFSDLDPTISLIEKSNIKKIADTEAEANTLMGLSIETSNIGWLANSSTSFYTNANHKYDGDLDYIGGNNPSAPTLLFYLHHSKNITDDGEVGSVIIHMDSIRQIDALNKETKALIITVNISRVLYDTVNYEGAMTAGRKYDLFTSTATNITSSSAISAYYSLFNVGNSIYRTGYHRALVSDYILPLNTKITMIDLSSANPQYYYKTITQADVTSAQQQMTLNREVAYNLSMFETMGAQNSGVYYDDVQKNSDYCVAGVYCNEDFIFIIDFGDTTISNNALNNKLLIEIRDSNDETIYSVLAPQHADLIYNVYVGKDALIRTTGTLSTNKIYNGETFTADMEINYTQSMVGSVTVYDTHYFDSKLGIKISLLDSHDEVVKGVSLIGLYYEIDGVRYYPNIDGTARIKIADKVDSAEKWIIINTGTSTIASGNYKLKIESFGSPDGLYYGLNSSDSVLLNLEIVNEIYGLDAETTPEEMIINAETGLNANGENTIIYDIEYNSGLTNPSIKFMMLRRDYSSVNSSVYSVVNAENYFQNQFRGGNQTNEYTIVETPVLHNSFTFILKDDLVTGTYRMRFILYDGNSVIGSVDKYIIIK